MSGIPLFISTARGVIIACCASASSMVAIGQVNISANPQGPSQNAPYVPTLAYDAVSIRECAPVPQGIDFENPAHSGRLRGKCVWAEQLVGLAYGVPWADRVLGGPDWVRTVPSNVVRFDVVATSDDATENKLANLSNDQALAEKRHMLQQLLAERFKLEAHIENRDRPVLALVVAKSGPKMQLGDPPPPSLPGEQGPRPKQIENKTDPHGTEIVGNGVTMRQLARVLELWLRKSVVDQTGLTGSFNFDLKFHGMLSDMAPDDDSMWPPVETAIKVFGLELNHANTSQRVVVIDNIEMPSPN